MKIQILILFGMSVLTSSFAQEAAPAAPAAPAAQRPSAHTMVDKEHKDSYCRKAFSNGKSCGGNAKSKNIRFFENCCDLLKEKSLKKLLSKNNQNHPTSLDIKVNNTALDGEKKQPLENTNHRPEGRAADDEHTTAKAHKAD